MKTETLAIDGGTPLRTKPFPPAYLGCSLYGEEEIALVTEVIRHQAPFRHYGLKKPHFAEDLEAEAREYLGVRFALALNSGTSALHCAIAALGIGPGDEVILPAFSWWSNFQTVILAGALPVFVEVDGGLMMDPEDFAKKITPRTRAAMVIHFQGASADLERILETAKAHGVAVIEDVAQAVGAAWRGRMLGSIGDIGCFSFQQNKVVTSGEGGLFTTNDPLLFERAVRFHDLGLMRPCFASQLEPGKNPQSTEVGSQFRMSEITAAVALAQWRKLDSRIIGPTRRYWRVLKGELAAACPGIRFRPTGDEAGDIGIGLFVDCESGARAKRFSDALKAEGIPVGATSSVNQIVGSRLVQDRKMISPAASPFGKGQQGEHVHYDPTAFPATDRHIARLVCLPIVPLFSQADVNDIRDATIKVWSAL